jgi:membrane glycosyltransferase
MGVLIALQARFVPPEYFSAERSLFPQWPAQDPVRSMWVFVGTMGVLLLPKLLSLVALIADRETRRGCGGGLRALLSVVAETLIAGLIAPVAMLIQSAAVVSILIGRDAGWKPQRRDDGQIPFGSVARRYWAHTLFGLALGVSSWLVAPTLLLWMLPVVLGMVLAIPLAVLTGSPAIGRAFARAGLLLIPEERRPPEVLARARACARELAHSLRPMEAVERLAADERLRDAHRLMLPAPRRPRVDPIDATLLVGLAKTEEAGRLEEALGSLTKAEKAAALADAAGVDRLLRLADRRRF